MLKDPLISAGKVKGRREYLKKKRIRTKRIKEKNERFTVVM